MINKKMLQKKDLINLNKVTDKLLRACITDIKINPLYAFKKQKNEEYIGVSSDWFYYWFKEYEIDKNLSNKDLDCNIWHSFRVIDLWRSSLYPKTGYVGGCYHEPPTWKYLKKWDELEPYDCATNLILYSQYGGSSTYCFKNKINLKIFHKVMMDFNNDYVFDKKLNKKVSLCGYIGNNLFKVTDLEEKWENIIISILERYNNIYFFDKCENAEKGDPLCVICYTKLATLCGKYCGHLCVCNYCNYHQKSHSCPICKEIHHKSDWIEIKIPMKMN